MRVNNRAVLAINRAVLDQKRAITTK